MYERGDVDEGLMRGLADHMTHSSAIQKQYYAKQKRLKTGAALQRIIMQGLGAVGGGSGAVVGQEGEEGEAQVSGGAVVGAAL